VPVLNVLILTASVGEGHDRPARWLAEQLRLERRDANVLVEDCLPAMGRVVTVLSESAPRVVFYRLRWLWDFAFWLFTAPVARGATQRLLTRLGGRGLLRLVDAAQADVVVSVYPQATEVLARLRRSGRLGVPVVAGITDVAALSYWASRGVDVHLVTQPESIAEVRRIAGADAEVHTVHGFIDPAFYEPRSKWDARLAVGLPTEGMAVLVSGGGWGVGDVSGAVAEALELPEVASVVCLAGRNDELRDVVQDRFAAEPRVRVEGFTEQMADWLAAADVLIHSTGGLTVLEALLRGCPVVSYGWGRGHIRKHNEAFRRFSLAEVVDDRAQLRAAIMRALAGDPQPVSLGELRSAASFVLAAGDAR
jgi:UDP-N-acetylglucosamine:LPS N-acetylglucosamine transferase